MMKLILSVFVSLCHCSVTVQRFDDEENLKCVYIFMSL